MATKAELLEQAEELGLSGLSEEDSNDKIKAAIDRVTNGRSLTVAQLLTQSRQLLGVHRSVVRGAVSAGFISDPSTVGAAEKGVQKFLEYTPGGE